MTSRKPVKPKKLTSSAVRKFRHSIYQYYRNHGRSLPWRKTKNPYRILVSEIMLQQTRVERVNGKYQKFIRAFPDFSSLAKASSAGVLRVWQGLGYNRRALALKKIAQIIMQKHKGKLPSDPEVLVTLPGIGKATAGAVSAFAFNRPAIFIETNTRRVFIHFFFHDRRNVKDAEILPLVERTLDVSNPREWYYALMDYGAMLKKTQQNPNRRSAHYRKQSPFTGSNRQLRGMILKVLLKEPGISESALLQRLKAPADRIKKNLTQLETEGFLKRKGKRFIIP